MKYIQLVLTKDGVTHTDEKQAIKHLEMRYADILLSHSRNLANQNYTFTSEYIDQNLSAFLELYALKAEIEAGIKFEEEEEYEED